MELFDFDDSSANDNGKNADCETAADFAALEAMLEQLDEIAPNARDDALHALLYGYRDHVPANPPFTAIKRFVQKVTAAAKTTGGAVPEEARRRAEQIREDRLDPDTEQVHTAAYKVRQEFDRLRGLLRFKAEPAQKTEEGAGGEFRYTARCAPDHFCLPLLADHFWRRFGETSWTIIDEKRNIALVSEAGGEPVLRQTGAGEKTVLPESGREENIQKSGGGTGQDRNTDEWEHLWKNYHRAVNNESRASPQRQKQFMPRRYWKYVTEMEE